MKSSRGPTWRPLSLAAVFLAPVVGCATLAPIEVNECGNSIVEAGEDCERFVPGGDATLHCGAAGSARACRFTCSFEDPQQRCPDGYGCGADEVCRAASGRFAREASRTTSSSFALAAADFDGDGRAEIVATSPRLIEVLAVDPLAGELVRNARLVPSRERNGLPSVGPSSDGGRLALIRSDGLASLFQHAPGSGLEAQFFAAFAVDGLDFRLLIADVLPGAAFEYWNIESLGLIDAAGGTLLNYFDPAIRTVPLARFDRRPSELARRAPGARFDETLPCDELVLPFVAAPSFTVARLCRPLAAPADGVEPNKVDDRHVAHTTITLEPGHVLGSEGAHVVDLDGDGHLDVIVDAKRTSDGAVVPLVAFGTGAATFHGAPTTGTPPAGFPDGTARPSPLVDECSAGAFPVAIGHLTTADAVLDCVVAGGVYYRNAAGDLRLLRVGSKLVEATIKDVNADGILDVVAATGASVEILAGTGSFGHRFSLPATSPGLLAVADVDGDRAADIAFRQTAESGETTLELLYGRAYAWPDLPVRLGSVAGIEQILAAPVSDAVGGFDDLGDIGIVQRNQTPNDPNRVLSVALVRGNTARQLEAPFAIGRPDALLGSRQAPIDVLALGRFTASPSLALGVVAMTNGRDAPAPNRQFWLVPPGEPGTLDPADSKPGTDFVDGRYLWEHARAVAVDLDGDRIDELVVIAPPDSAAAKGRVWVAAAREGAFVLRTTFELGAHAGDAPRWQIAATDFDGDGAGDVTFLVDEAIETGGETRVEPQVITYFGEGGSLRPAPARLTIQSAAKPRAITIGRVAKARARGLLVATDRIHVVSFESREPLLGREIDDIELAGPPHAIAAADLDGDGVDDIVVADGSSLTAHFALPENP